MPTRRGYRERKYNFGQQLLSLRTRVPLTQAKLAQQIGVHRRSVQNWETGESYPKTDVLRRLIELFLQHHAFAPGREYDEATTFWRTAAQDGPQTIAGFDEEWFAGLLHQAAAIPTPTPGAPPQPPTVERSPRFIDWGEAIDVAALYGREHELATLREWIVDDCCRVVTLVGLGGIGKSSLALRAAQRMAPAFDRVLFRSLQNEPPLADIIDQIIRAVSAQQSSPPDRVTDKIALLVQLFREQRCLLILDNFESVMQGGALTGSYRSGYDAYGALLHALGDRSHRSCLMLTSREKPAELGKLEGRTTPVRTLPLGGLDDTACQRLLETKDIVGTTAAVRALAHLYGGNPLALALVSEPIRELFDGNIQAFLDMGAAFFNGVGTLLEQQFARSTAVEQAILRWLAIEREVVPLDTLVERVRGTVSRTDLIAALDSLRRRLLIERAPGRAGFTLQPVILEYVGSQLVELVKQELLARTPHILQTHALVQATAKEYVRRSQERLLATPLLEQLISAGADAEAITQQLVDYCSLWRRKSPTAQGYGPGNIINLLRVLRGNLRGLDFAWLSIRQAYLQDIDMVDASLAHATLEDSRLSESFGSLSAVAVSPTGAYWAAASRRGEARLWAAGGTTLHRVWRPHTDMITPGTLRFTSDDHTLISGGLDGALHAWDVARGERRWSARHTGGVFRFALSPDSSMLAHLGSGADPAVTIRDTQHGRLLHILPHPITAAGIAWSSNGRWLASGDITGTLRVWEWRGAEPVRCMQTFTGHMHPVVGVAFAPDSSRFASASWDNTVKVWNIAEIGGESEAGWPQHTLAGHSDRVSAIAWSPDGTLIASGSRDRTVRLWDVAQGAYCSVLQGHTDEVWDVAFTPDNRTLVSVSEDGTARVWDVASGQCVRVIQGHAVSIFDVDWSPDGQCLVSGGSDGVLTIWERVTARPLHVLRGHTTGVSGVGWSPDGRRIASSTWDGAIQLWEPTSGEYAHVLREADPGAFSFYGLAWSPDGKRLASGTFLRSMHVYDVSTRQVQWAGRETPTFIEPVAWSPDGAWIAAGCDEGIIYVWDANDGTLFRRLAGHQSMVTSIAWSADGTWVASGGNGSEGGELFVWDLQRGECISTTTRHPGSVAAIAPFSKPTALVTGSSDGLLRWWDLQRDAAVHAYPAHRGTVQSIKRSPDGMTLASCGDDGAIVLWDDKHAKQLHILRHDRPYERMDITSLRGVTEAQRASLVALGAMEHER